MEFSHNMSDVIFSHLLSLLPLRFLSDMDPEHICHISSYMDPEHICHILSDMDLEHICHMSDMIFSHLLSLLPLRFLSDMDPEHICHISSDMDSEHICHMSDMDCIPCHGMIHAFQFCRGYISSSCHTCLQDSHMAPLCSLRIPLHISMRLNICHISVVCIFYHRPSL